jgi:uncharacterized surface protein with fasciclin (FAS1) repeats
MRFALSLAVPAVAAFALAMPAVAEHHDHDAQTQASAPGNIVEVATAAGSFNTLAAALDAAGLVETLQGDGPFTVFAPTDEAFAALPEGTVEALLQPENRDQLINILTYHVVPGEVDAAAALDAGEATAVNGGTLTIESSGDQAMVNGTNIVATDVQASNGIIHVIDAVLLPPAE